MDARSVVAVLDDLLAERGEPCFIHLDNGPEFIAFELTDWREEVGVDLYFIEPGSPWFNGKVESFNGRLRDTFSMALNGALFESIAEAQGPLDRWTAGPLERRIQRKPAPQLPWLCFSHRVRPLGATRTAMCSPQIHQDPRLVEGGGDPGVLTQPNEGANPSILPRSIFTSNRIPRGNREGLLI